MLSFKGLSCTIIVGICIVLSAAVAEEASIPSGTPYVLNANEVPVAGGILYIYGLFLGDDASQIKVEILDRAQGGTIECKNVTIVLPNSILSCAIEDIGTGRSKHIAVTVNGVTNDIKADSNMVFSRHAPKLQSLTYALEKALVVIQGSNFGNNMGLISVTLDGNKYPLVSVNDSFIVCSRLSNNDPPANRHTIVEVDGQGSTEDLVVIVDASVTKVEIVDKPSTSEGDKPFTPEGGFNGGYNTEIPKDKINVAWIIVGAAAGGVAISIFVISLLVMRRRRAQRELDAVAAATAAAATASKDVVVVTDPMDVHVGMTLPPLTRDQSMVEIDLKEANALACSLAGPGALGGSLGSLGGSQGVSRGSLGSSLGGSQGVSRGSLAGSGSIPRSFPVNLRRSSVYEQNAIMVGGDDSSSDSESSMSPTSSACSSPTDSPCPSPMTSHKNDSEVPAESDSNSTTSSNTNSETPIPVFPKTKRPFPPPLDLDHNAKSSFSMTPPTAGPHAKSSAKIRGMIRVPSSRIANRALDSPYFAKQGAFDSPKMGASFDSPNM